MLHDLIKKWRGKELVVMTGDLSKVNDRKKTLLAGQRSGIKGQRVEYVVRPSTDTEKFQTGPNTQKFSGGDAQSGPRLTKWSK